MNYADQFQRARRNDAHSCYKVGADWYFDDRFGRRHGPYLNEETCAAKAQDAEDKDNE